MFDKIKKVIQDDLQRRYEQLEERFLVFEQRLYGRLADRLDGLENQLDQLSEILRQKASRHKSEDAENDDAEETPKTKKEPKSSKKTTPKAEKIISDDLMKLPGLGNSMEKKLNAEGVFTFNQLASLSELDLENLNIKIPGLKIRYERYEWRKEAAAYITK
jgi:predicted flap endonuclease-1-like 5' DNA nuclease